MDNLDPYRNDDPITYAVKTGDISRGASPTDVSSMHNDNVEVPHDDIVAPVSKSQAILALAVAVIFLAFAVLSF